MKNEGNPSDFWFLKVEGVIGESLRERDLCEREKERLADCENEGMREMSLKDQYLVF